MSNKVRVVYVEADASDEAVREILRTLSFAPMTPAAVPALAPGGASVRQIEAAVELPAPAPAPAVELPAAAAPVERRIGRPKNAAPAAAPVERRIGRPKDAAVKAAVVAAAAPEGGKRGDTRTVVEAALRKRPMTSGEVIQATGLEAQKVYQMLAVLRSEGVVESREGAGPFKMQHLVEGGK